MIDEHHASADERGQQDHPDDQQPPAVPGDSAAKDQGNHRQAAEVDRSFGIDERLPEDEQADIDQPAQQAERRAGIRDQSQMQQRQQGDQQPTLALAQRATQALQRGHARLSSVGGRESGCRPANSPALDRGVENWTDR